MILVPLGTKLTPHEIEFIARDAGLRGFIYAGEFAETVRAVAGATNVERWIALDEPASPGHARLADFLAAAEPRPDRAAAPRPGPEDICCLLYTSGTTGKPKGVMVPHRMVAWNGYNTAMCWQLREDDVSPIFTPLYHAGGLGAFLLPVFSIGGTIVLHAGFDPEEIWRTIERERCTVVLGVPTIYKLLMEAPAFQTVDLSHVRWLISGGAPLPLYIIEAYQRRGVVFKQGYGLTEVGVNCFSMTVAESARKKGSIGKPMMFTEARAALPDGIRGARQRGGRLRVLPPPRDARRRGAAPRPRAGRLVEILRRAAPPLDRPPPRRHVPLHPGLRGHGGPTSALLGEARLGLGASRLGFVFAYIGVVMVIVQGGLVGRLAPPCASGRGRHRHRRGAGHGRRASGRCCLLCLPSGWRSSHWRASRSGRG